MKDQTKRFRYTIVLLAVLLGISLPVALYGAYAATTGTPLVLVSEDYITNYLLPLINQKNGVQDTELESLNNKYSTLLAQYEALSENYNKLLESGIPGATSTVPGFTAVKVEAGKMIVPTGSNQVCLEVIVQRGNAVVFSPIETQGILDTSTGNAIFDGAEIVQNHYLLIPHANDGRAIAAPEADVWILVRGE